MDPSLTTEIWNGLGWPLLRLCFFVSIGLAVANIIESFNWTHAVAKVTSPLIRFGHLSDICGASFSMAFFSGVAANTMLAESYDDKKISHQELILANLFNSLPTYFLHFPTLFFIAVPLIKKAAIFYVGATLLAAFLRTAVILIVGRLTLPLSNDSCIDCQLPDNDKRSLKEIMEIGLQKFINRIKRILSFTVPIYIGIFICNKAGIFNWLESVMANNIGILTWLHPESLGIIVFHIAAELTAGLAAAGALLDAGTLPVKEVVIALLIGNIISSPVRAIRHQFPFYAGIFPVPLAIKLIIYNQAFRAISIIFVAFFYIILF